MKTPATRSTAAMGRARKDRTQRASTTVIVALGLVALVGAAAITVDVGEAYRVSGQLENAAMTAALSGAQFLPGDTQAARTAAVDVAARNGVPADHVQVSFAASAAGRGVTDLITVTTDGRAQYRLARVLGVDHSDLTRSATAQIGSTVGLQGLVPLGVAQQSFQVGIEYTLKYDNHTIVPGNFGGLDFGGSDSCGNQGANCFEYYLEYGYPEMVDIGDDVTTETGNMKNSTDGLQPRIDADPNATCDTVQPGSPRIIYAPIVDYSGATGSDQVPVVGFAAFFLVSAGGGAIEGCYLHAMAPGEWAAYDPVRSDVLSVRLVK